MDWLENIRVTQGKETFTDIADKVQPALAKAAVGKDDKRAADALAHLGWADFLRSRDGKGGLDPVRYYREALRRDPANPYAHAFWGHYLMVSDGDAREAKAHFDRALASRALQPFVHGLEISALLWRGGPAQENEVVRIANEMRVQGDAPPVIGGEPLTSRIWNIYYDRLVFGSHKEEFLTAVPAEEHLATFEWLFPDYANSTNRTAYLFMAAQLQEHKGARAEALATYRSILTALTAQGAGRASLATASRQAVQRLQRE